MAFAILFCSLGLSQFLELFLVLAYSSRISELFTISVVERIGDVYVLSDYSRIVLTESQASSLTFMRIVVLFLLYAIFMYSAQYVGKRFFGIDFLEEMKNIR